MIKKKMPIFKKNDAMSNAVKTAYPKTDFKNSNYMKTN